MEIEAIIALRENPRIAEKRENDPHSMQQKIQPNKRISNHWASSTWG
jgi:hypothetical protein